MIEIAINKINMNPFFARILSNMVEYLRPNFIFQIRMPVLCRPDEM